MWLLFASTASILWGLSYTLSEQIYRHIYIYTTLAAGTLIMSAAFFVAAWSKGVLAPDLVKISTVPKVFVLFSFGIAILALAELFIALSITSKSAALAGLIEISYPLFIALFSYLLFNENELNVPTAIGGLLIFSGVAVVYWFSK